VQRAGVEIDQLVLAPLATGEAVLADEDRDLGVCLVDVGGDTTDVAIFQDGTIAHAATVPMGARSITADLGIVLRVTPDVAESVKLRHGTALPLEVDPDEVVQITSIGEDVSHGVTRRHVAEIVEARVFDLFRLVAAEIDSAGATNRLQAGLVLTGGGSLLQGLTRAARDQLGMSARVTTPRGLGGLTDSVSAPPYAASSGLLLWGARSWSEGEEHVRGRAPGEGISARLTKLFRGLMP